MLRSVSTNVTVGENPFATASAKAKKVPIGQVLQNTLAGTLNGRVQWQHSQHKKPGSALVEDVFETTRNGTRIQLTSVRPVNEVAKAIDTLGNWEIKMEKTGKKPAILDGKTLLLPEELPEGTQITENTIPKLFKAVYEDSGQRHSKLLPWLEKMTERLQARMIPSAVTHIKPDFRYNFPLGAKIFQIGEGNNRIEIAQKIGDKTQFTFHRRGRIHRFSDDILRNPAVKAALENLVEEAMVRQNEPARKKVARR